ncbi:MAG: hypothetical protein E3J70_01610 [Candidatus Heimdallarchaeota archaeon]|nr:MAG: hypothetical protein E3J70_01610 [Candidatus Heimdallarchaeota archaeon]
MIDKKEILERVGLINTPDSAYKTDRINLQLVVPRNIMIAMEEKIKEKYRIKGSNSNAQTVNYILLAIVNLTFFDDQGELEKITRTLADAFKFSEIEPKMDEIADP